MQRSLARGLSVALAAGLVVVLGIAGTSWASGGAAAANPPLRVTASGAAARPAGTTASGSLTYYKGGNIFTANADGSNPHQLTTGGGWLWTSMADDGTVVAEGPGETAPDGTQGMDLYVYKPNGTLDHRITTPSDYSNTNYPAYAPNTVRISPDGTKIAYWNWEGGEQLTLWTPTTSTNLNFPNQTLGQENDENPAWIDNTHLLLDDPGAWGCLTSPQDPIIRTYHVGDGDNTNVGWFDDKAESGTFCYAKDGWASDYFPTMSRQGDKLAIFDSNSGLEGGSPTKVSIRLFSVANTTQAPTFKCELALPASQYNSSTGLWVGYASPTFSPDGTQLAWGENDGIHVANVSDLSNCAGITQSLLIPGGALPSFSAFGGAAPPAAITLTPKKGAAGTSVTVNGSGFTAGATVKLSFADSAKHKTALGSVTANGSGAFSKAITIPAGAAKGKGKVTATGGGASAKATFTVA
jgi:hypothetical protein